MSVPSDDSKRMKQLTKFNLINMKHLKSIFIVAVVIVAILGKCESEKMAQAKTKLITNQINK